MLSKIRRCLALLLCAVLMLPLMVVPVEAQKAEVTIIIGKPNIWSLAQAHYLLANMRQENRGLKVASPGQLNANSINGTRFDLLRTLLGVEAQFSTPQGLQNSVAQQQFQADFARKQSAIARMDELSREHLDVIRQISDLDVALAALGPQPAADKQDAATERRRDELTRDRAAKVALRDAIAGQITTVGTQANAAATLSNLQTAFPLGTPSPPTLPGEGIGDIKDIVSKLAGATAPDVDASQKLDNYIDLQYEVIAKQLTLLRDEVGPDERLVFLELPSSLYTVPKRDDDQVVQIDWQVPEYFGLCPGTRSRNMLVNEDGNVEEEEAANNNADQNDPAQPETADADSASDRNYAASNVAQDSNASRGAAIAAAKRAQGSGQPPPVTEDLLARFFAVKTTDNLARLANARFLDDLNLFEKYEKYEQLRTSPNPKDRQKFNGLFDEDKQRRAVQLRANPGVETLRAVSDLRKILGWYPQLIDMGWMQSPDAAGQPGRPSNSLCPIRRDTKPKVRVIDIVPRQSALNINDTHATQKGFALAAKFLTLFGFGGQVSYQRQRSIYEQFINQDVFASGFGKGTDKFGWTMGPLPGTKRLAPGPRTTFAILAVPSHAWQINLRANAIAFPRTKSPTNPDDARFRKPLTPPGQPASFDLFVPNESTEGFWADSINYTPVRKGERVTAVIGGRYFSPLTGVMVDGIPLKRAVAIAKHESDTTTLPLAADSPGEYEYLNPNQIVISFRTSDATFVGTPLIILVTPEKTAAINFFRDMRINFRFTDSLQRHSLIEPMFMDDFGLTRLEVDKKYLDDAAYPPGTPITVRLTGAGFRRRAEVCLGDHCVTDPPLTNTSLLELTLRKPAGRVWTITYRLGQKMASKDFDTLIDGQRAIAPTIESIENPSTNRAEGLIAGGYTVIIRGSNLQNVSKISFGSAEVTGSKIKQKHPNVLIVEVPPGQEGGVQVLLEGTIPAAAGQPAQPVSNILDFITPGKAMFKYIKPPDKPAGQT